MIKNKILPFLSLIWIGLQIKGSYWLLVALLLFSLVRARESLLLFFSCTRHVVLSALLLTFSLSLLASAAFDSGLQGLVSEIPVTLPILPMFILPAIALRQGEVSLYPRSKYLFYVLGVGFLTVLSALWQWTQLADSPASSLRPLELQASSGVFLLTTISTSCLSLHSIGPKMMTSRIYISILSLALSLVSLACFRGAASASAFVLSATSVFLFFILPIIRRLSLYLLGLLLLFCALSLTLILDFRFLFLKFLVVPFFSDDLANGRLALLQNWIVSYGQDPLQFVGSQSSVPADFFAHNLFLDSLIKDGSVAAASILLFAVAVFLYLLRDLSVGFDKRRFLNLLQFCFMAVVALLQPVQFSHAFAFLLSFSTFGMLVSIPSGQLPDTPSPSLRL